MTKALAAWCLFVILALAGCRGGSADAVRMEFDGVRYVGVGLEGMVVAESAVQRIGNATNQIGGALVVGSDVYSIAGVDPGEAVAMKSASAAGYMVFVRAMPDGINPLDPTAVAGLCQYFVDPKSCTPSGT
jgi:hypothetical protein